MIWSSQWGTAETKGLTMARITGIGGVFFKTADPAALSKWYRDVLGFPVEEWGGAQLMAKGGPPYSVWSPFKADTTYFEPSTASFMINFAVDDLDGFLTMLAARGVTPLKRDDSDPAGRFAWILDPAGNKLELWQPKS